MDLGIRGRRAVVTASSSGLGRAAAMALAAEGARVIIVARDRDRLEQAAGDIEAATGERPLPYSVDLQDGAAVDRFASDVQAAEGPIDILVTNTGGPPARQFHECSPEDWENAFRLLLLSPIRLIRGFLPGMREGGWGRIVCVTSVSAKEPMENLILSTALRAGVAGMAKSLSREVAAEGVLVNTIAPGFHHTPALDRLVAKLVEQGKAASADEVFGRWQSAVPAGRIGDTDGFGRMVAFLASDACDYVTGTNVTVDGGRSQATF